MTLKIPPILWWALIAVSIALIYLILFSTRRAKPKKQALAAKIISSYLLAITIAYAYWLSLSITSVTGQSPMDAFIVMPGVVALIALTWAGLLKLWGD